MTEEEKLQKAYFVMGLEPGAALDKVTRRHKRLIMVWHPDRFPTADGKKEAEEELKQINNAKDDLKSHFEKDHKASGSCPCKPSAGSTSQAGQSSSHSGPGPGPGRRRTTQEADNEEAAAEQRSKAREQQAAAEEAEKRRQKQASENPQPAQPTAQQEADQAKLREDERLRWKVSVCLGIAWIALSLFGFVGTGLKAWWHDFAWKWERDHAPQQQSSPPPQANSRYVPPYQRSPNTTTASPFGDEAPPPTEQPGSPYSTLDSLNRQSVSDTTMPAATSPTAPSGLSSPAFQSSTPNLFPLRSQGLGSRTDGLLNQTPSSNSLLRLAPNAAPSNAPIEPSGSGINDFSKTLNGINQKSGQ
jgi:curved DNA-binding protein CbpA